MKIKIKFILIFVTLILFKEYVCPDAGSYAGNKVILLSNDSITIIHRHDWTLGTKEKRWRMFMNDQNPFTKTNDYAYIECINNKTHDILFKRPTPALTYLFISDNSKYIIGLSNIKLLNTVHIVLFNNFGDLLFRAAISVDEVKMDFDEFQTFKSKFPKYARKVEKLKLVYRINNSIYINFDTMSLFSEKVRKYLFKWVVPSHLSKNFSESETNFIDWYKEPDPEIQLKYENGTVSAISLLDPAGERFEIEIKSYKN